SHDGRPGGSGFRWTDGDATIAATLYEGFTAPFEPVLKIGASPRISTIAQSSALLEVTSLPCGKLLRPSGPRMVAIVHPCEIGTTASRTGLRWIEPSTVGVPARKRRADRARWAQS